MNHPLLLVFLTLAGIWIAKLWHDDLKAAESGHPNPNALPGATRAPWQANVIAASGALGLLAAETAGEAALGIAGQQSHLTWWFALYSVVAAPPIEELMFRGWLVVENRGRVLQWAGVVGASVAFAALHPFLWRMEDTGFILQFNVKGWFSTGVVFATSLWLYVTRLASWNPRRSLLPCMTGHFAKNVGVVAIKVATGFIDSPW